jgi:hypothetical protein
MQTCIASHMTAALRFESKILRHFPGLRQLPKLSGVNSVGEFAGPHSL